MIKKTILSLILISFLSFQSFSQDASYETDYNLLLFEYEALLDDYEDLLDEYETSINDHEKLNIIYESEVEFHEISKEQIELDQTEIKMLREHLETVMKLADPRYFTAFITGGMVSDKQAFDVGLSAQIPRLPFSVIGSVGYVIDRGFSFSIGAGVKF